MVLSSGVMAHVQLSWLDPHKERRLTVVGSKRMVVFDDMQPREKLKVTSSRRASPTWSRSMPSCGTSPRWLAGKQRPYRASRAV